MQDLTPGLGLTSGFPPTSQIKEDGSVLETYLYDPTNPNSPGLDQLTSWTKNSVTKTFVHRPDGEMTNYAGNTVNWDTRGGTIGGSFNGSSLSYTFDPLGRWRTRVGAGTTTQYRYAGVGAAPLFETNTSGVIQLSAVDSPAGDLAHYAGPPANGSTVSFAYYNGHGDLAATADLSGARTGAFTYDPFGAPLQAPTANKATKRWTGLWDKRNDSTSSFIQMGIRPYAPDLGRFLARDPIVRGALNLYEYARQDPVNLYDLDGLAAVEPNEVDCWRLGGGLNPTCAVDRGTWWTNGILRFSRGAGREPRHLAAAVLLSSSGLVVIAVAGYAHLVCHKWTKGTPFTLACNYTTGKVVLLGAFALYMSGKEYKIVWRAGKP